jgi:integrase
MKVKERFWEDEVRGMLRGRFYSLVEPGQQPKIYNLCTLDHYYSKTTKRGKQQRGDVEMKNLQEQLYNDKLNEKKIVIEKGVKKSDNLEEAENHTVSEAIAKFRKDYLPNRSKSTRKGYNHALDYWDDVFGSMKLSELNDDDIQEKRDALEDPKVHSDPEAKYFRERSDSTLNRYTAALSSMLKACIEDFKWCGIYEMKNGKRKKVGNMVNPCKGVKAKEEPDSRVRFLQPKEAKELLDSCTPELKDAVMLSLLTGARKKEIWELRFDSINFEKDTISFWQTKNGKPRTVPIKGEGLDILKRRFHNKSNDWVFPSCSGNDKKGTKKYLDRPKSFEKAWDNALAESGVKDFKYHDLRHTAASYMVMEGVTLSAVCEVLGHSDISQTYKYAHLAPSHLQEAMVLLSKGIHRIIT